MTTPDEHTLAPITEGDIANYLLNTPDFFERYAAVLSGVQLVSPHGARAVSLQERQVEILREKMKTLEMKAVGMIRHGHANASITDKLLGWVEVLLRVREPADLPPTLCEDMKQRFALPQAVLRLWGVDPAYAGLAAAAPLDSALQDQLQALTEPVCGLTPEAGLSQALRPCLAPGMPAASLAVVPLRAAVGGPVVGALLLASDDAQRFTADMGTDFLLRIADMAGAALSRLYPAA
jgi:uncharacterized protein YigA (DUF484 family)